MWMAEELRIHKLDTADRFMCISKTDRAAQGLPDRAVSGFVQHQKDIITGEHLTLGPLRPSLLGEQ